MKALIAILILLSFLQTSIVPLDLVLIVLLLRTYLVGGKENLVLAFSFGLLVAFLSNHQLGLDSLIYLFLIELTEVFRKTPLYGNWLLVAPLVLVLLGLQALIQGMIFHQTLMLWPKLVVESLLSLPVYLILRFWEERFVVKDQIKLKV